jgi:UDP-N-acetylmuramyl pentapeptide phosphotransferase/UDP-N-acetylglucosamine-1-phosphate transferase
MTLLEKIFPFAAAFGGALAATLVLTPIFRELHRILGMVDKPDPRRINKVPIPRGGGIAVVLGLYLSYALFILISGYPAMLGFDDRRFLSLAVLSVAIALLGLADDRFSLPPKIKLLGQLVVAALTWFWSDVGFTNVWPEIPLWVDCLLTVFWIVGAVNAFNLIDGLDGLASGIALIATVGIGGGVFFSQSAQATFFYFAFAGSLLGFLRCNYNPASVFLGDCGSMFIGFMLATLPLCSEAPNQFLVSVGMPVLAMGVPIFDTSLAIIRRSIRRFLYRGDNDSKGEVMAADKDHLHHRILRSVNLNQRRAAWILYALAAAGVVTGLFGMYLESRAAGLWLFAFAVASVVVVKDLARIELFEAGRLLNDVAHSQRTAGRRRLARMSTVLLLMFDVMALFGVFVFVCWTFKIPPNRDVLRIVLPVWTAAAFLSLVFFRAYSTVWSRAMMSNFVRLLAACVTGAIIASVATYYAPLKTVFKIKSFAITYTAVGFIVLACVRLLRSAVRDFFYAIDCSRLKARKDVSRILVYGTGLRYRAFRRELVRSASRNSRIIVGLLDDDVLLWGKYIGGMKILGGLGNAAETVNSVNADSLVIACELSDERLAEIAGSFKKLGIKVSVFSLNEKEV